MARGDKGKQAASSSRARVTAIAEHPRVELISTEQKKRFQGLMSAPLLATRFLCVYWMQCLELGDTLTTLFNGTGFGFLYGMAEITFPSLTLEFLSSFEYDFDNERVSFRLLNTSYNISLREFGNLFDFASGGLDHAPDSFSYLSLWGCMCRDPPRRVSSLRISVIEHPALRFWFRTLGGTIFGRTEPGNTNKHELEILGSYLNVQRQVPYCLNLAHFVATHFSRVAKGTVKTIEIGGIITYIAKRLGGDNFTSYTPIDTAVPLIDRQYVRSQLKWSSREDDYRWKMGGRWLNLPCPYLPPLTRLSPAGGNEQPYIPSYLIEAPLALQGDQANDDDAQFPPGYDQPDPNTMPSPAPAYPGPYGAHHSYASNVDTQRYIDSQLSTYPTYHEHVMQGHVPRDGPHPSYYTGPEGQYGGYPGRIFSNAGISQGDWGPAFWGYQGGQGSGSGEHFGGNANDGGGDGDDE